MNKLWTLVILVLVGAVGLYAVFTKATSAPFDPWIEDITGDVTFSSAGSAAIASDTITTTDLVDQDADGELVQRMVRFTYDVASDGGGVGTVDTGQDLPANALVTKTSLYIDTEFTKSGSPTFALHCEDAGNLKSATDISVAAAVDLTAGSSTSGVQTGDASTWSGGIASACNITVTIATATFTAGKLNGFVEYYLHD